jgi:hypothetical protein
MGSSEIALKLPDATKQSLGTITQANQRYHIALAQTLLRVGKLMADYAKQETARGPRGGSVFLPRKYGAHVPVSAPGEPPQYRTGFLQNSIGWTLEDGGVKLFDTAPYASFLEDGTDNIEQRPFLAPAQQQGCALLPVIGQQEMDKAWRAK